MSDSAPTRVEGDVAKPEPLPVEAEVVVGTSDTVAPPPPAAAEGQFKVGTIGRHAALYLIFNILSKSVAFLMLPIYTRYLSPADYGVAALIEMTIDVISIFSGAQLASGVFRFYHKVDTDADRRAVVSTALTAGIVSFGAVAVGIFLAAEPLSRLLFDSPDRAGLLRLASISFSVQGMIGICLAYGRILVRTDFVVGTMALKLFLSVGLNVLFIVGMGQGVRGIFLSTVLSNSITALWLGVWTVRRVGFGIRGDVLRWLVRFGLPLMGANVATFAMTFSDRYFLKAAADEAAVGLYNLAYQFGFLMLMLGFVPIDQIWGPKRFQIARGPNAGPVLAQVFRIINVSVLSIGVGIALFVGDMLRIMVTPPFQPAADIVPILLVAYVFHGWTFSHDIGIQVKERNEYLTISNWIGAIVALAGFAILVPPYHAFGAAIAAAIAFGVRWAVTYVFSQRLWKVPYEWLPMARQGAVVVLVTLIALLLPRMNLVMSIGVHALMFALYVALLWSLAILTPAEKQAVRDTVARVGRSAGDRLRRRSVEGSPR